MHKNAPVAVLGIIFGGPGHSSFGRLSEITIEPINSTSSRTTVSKNWGGSWARFGGPVPPGPNVEPPLECTKSDTTFQLFYGYTPDPCPPGLCPDHGEWREETEGKVNDRDEGKDKGEKGKSGETERDEDGRGGIEVGPLDKIQELPLDVYQLSESLS